VEFDKRDRRRELHRHAAEGRKPESFAHWRRRVYQFGRDILQNDTRFHDVGQRTAGTANNQVSGVGLQWSNGPGRGISAVGEPVLQHEKSIRRRLQEGDQKAVVRKQQAGWLH